LKNRLNFIFGIFNGIRITPVILSLTGFFIFFETTNFAENPVDVTNASIPYLSELSPVLMFTDTNTVSTDSNKSKIDSLLASDSSSVKADTTFKDSTARIKYFRYKLKPHFVTRFSEPHQTSFFAKPSNRLLQRTVSIDSTGKFVIIKELLAGKEYRPPLIIPLDQYIQMQLAQNRKDLIENEARKYKLKGKGDELGDLMSSITNISIPLPNAGFLSIFGPPRISLKINGAVDIHGAWRNETTEGLTASLLGNTKNEPDFKQQVQVNVSGTIGDKLNISADWNTERTFEYQNTLKIKYTGYSDEIIQSIEGGNVSMKTTPLTAGGEALFGVKAKFQLGPLSLTTIASQKKGEIQQVDVKGGSQTQDFEVHVWDYSEKHFFVDKVYADTSADFNFFNNYYGQPVFTPSSNQNYYHIKQLEVWKTTTGLPDISKERKGNAFIDLPGIQQGEAYDPTYRDTLTTTVNGRNEIGVRFTMLTPNSDYTYNEYAGFINFKTNIQKNEAVAVAYRIEGPTNSPDDDIFYGDFQDQIASDTGKVILLKLIKPNNLMPGGTYTDAWNLMLKNIYFIGGMDIKKEGFDLDLTYSVPGSDPKNELNGKRLLQLFNLDNTDADGTSTRPDGHFDFFPNKTILPATGEIIFPVLEPFGKQFPKGLPDSLKYQAVYDTTKTYAKQDIEKDRFLMKGQYSASTTSTFNIGFNVVENSVKVFLGGRLLQEGKDYQVDYNIGQVIIRNDAALVPGADLKITYEQNDLFSLASKTLVGARGIYEFNKDVHLGFSFMNVTQQSLNDKVRLGEEPLSNSIYGLDFQSKFDLPFVTNMLNHVISTSAKSAFSLNGEFAYINPDPNTKKSTITGDNGESIAYLDDFEGARRTIPIGVSFSGWKDISPPDSLDYHSGDLRPNLMNYKARAYWFNRIPTDVRVNQIWPEKKVSSQQQNVIVLDLVYNPASKGYYNYNENWDPNSDSTYKNWGGFEHLISSTANNLVDQKIEFVEFWAKIENAPSNAKLYIDLGQIDEDVIPNNRLNTEDKNKNGRLDDGEDTGIDGVTDTGEPGYNSTTNPDPSNDNFALNANQGEYEKINGTEGNAKLTDLGISPDTEDLNRNFNLDMADNYFRYVVPLDTVRSRNPYIAGGGSNGWYQFKIPLKDFKTTFGSPTFTFVETIRFFFQDIDSLVYMRMTEINLVGNQWEQVKKTNSQTDTDEVLTVSTINIEDNPEYYSPPGVIRERDRSQPNQTVLKNEQSLNLIFKDLPNGAYRDAIKYLVQKIDVFNYREMKLFFHGDLNQQDNSVSYYQAPDNYNTRIYFRFGEDTTNFYEYSLPLKSGWQTVSINLKDLPALKEARTLDTAVFRQQVPGKPEDFYGVKGSPSLTKINFFLVRVENPESVGPPVSTSGTIWVNELRILGADNTPGWAYTASSSLRLADFITINGNVRRQDPYFHKIQDRFGTRNDNNSWGMSVDLNLLKILPFNTEGSNLSLNYQRTESTTNPLFMPASDISVNKAVAQIKRKVINEGGTAEDADQAAKDLIAEVQSLSMSDAITLSNIKLRIPSRAWWIQDTFNALVFNFNFSRAFSRSPTVAKNEMWQWKGSGNYSVNLGRDLYIKYSDIPLIGSIFGFFGNYKNAKFRFAPNSFSTSLSVNRKYNYNLSRSTQSESQISQDFVAARTANMNWNVTEGSLLNLSLSYKLNLTSSLNYLLFDTNGLPRSEAEVWNDVLHGEYFGKTNNYQQSFSIKLKPKLPSLWKLDKFFTISGGYNVSYSWKNDFRQEELGRSAGFGSNITASLNLKWKALTQPLFPKVSTKSKSKNKNHKNKKNVRKKETPSHTHHRSNRGRKRNLEEEFGNGSNQTDNIAEESNVSPKNPEEIKSEETDDGKPSSIIKSLYLMRDVVHWALFDYDQFRFNFSQKNNTASSGLLSQGTGFTNFWGRNSDNNGPSRLFMLGLSNDAGPRAPNAQLSDRLSQNNSFTFGTQRPLWEGANLDINWKVNWGENRSYTVTTDDNGNITISNPNITGKTNRSFLTIPIKLFGSGITAIHDNYDPSSLDPGQSLSDAFVTGLETFPMLSKIPVLGQFANYLPRANWKLSWSGLEKLSFLKGIANRISFNHSYTSDYSEGWTINPDGKKIVQTQKISYAFQPLIGLDFTFNKLLGGNFRGSAKYGTKTNYNLGVSTRSVTEGISRDISVSISFSKSGFDLPIFGFNLKNDIEFSFSYTNSRTATIIYNMDSFDENGLPQDGTTRVTLEPRVKYMMSSRITLALFYKRSTVTPEGASVIPPTKRNEAGLDVHITIQ